MKPSLHVAPAKTKTILFTFLQYVPLPQSPRSSRHSPKTTTPSPSPSGTLSRIPTPTKTLSSSVVQFIPLSRPPRSRPSTSQSPSSSGTSPRTTTPTNTLSDLPLRFTSLDLELVHFYTTTTSYEILGQHLMSTHIWRTSIVTLSFQFPFLLSALFSLSALHLGVNHLKTRTQIESLGNGLRYRNWCGQCGCMLCFFLGLLSWATPGGQGASIFFSVDGTDHKKQVPWIKLHRGGEEILKSVAHWVENGTLGDIVRPWTILRDSPQPQAFPLTADDLKGDMARLDNMLTLEETLQTLRYTFFLLSMIETGVDIQISACVATFAWTTIVPARFCEMVEEKCPQVLVLVALYCILLKHIDEYWWIRGKVENLLDAVRNQLSLLGPVVGMAKRGD
ncbi:uncharacterized protein PAC_15811 [Phialocephala subalpina]|uniref:Uncharacterized protein n=1 Tax=Phialocephala subalpina TaxID=576137 RepID=A0A1L7XLH7_9HELO|nr:uncharacterized protein PAC_15811 [Phialocephala subalpina]